MTHISVSIKHKTATMNGNHCSFQEAGLYEVRNGNEAIELDDEAEIKEVLQDQYEGQDLDIEFED